MIKAPVLTCLTIGCTAFLASATNAQSIDAAHAAFVEGRFIEATELAQELKTSEGYALAAQSLAIHGHHFAREGEKQALFERATRLAEEAVRLDPRNPDARLQLAHALGRYTQTVDIKEVFNEDYPEKVRQELEEALRIKPDMAAAHFSLGSWHAEARHGGGIMAGILYGASEKDAMTHFEHALELAPDDKPTLYRYAHGLLLLDRKANYEQARDLLARAVELPSKDAYDRIIHGLVVELLEDLETHPPEPPRHPARLGQS